jgi:hypothetical protein
MTSIKAVVEDLLGSRALLVEEAADRDYSSEFANAPTENGQNAPTS